MPYTNVEKRIEKLLAKNNQGMTISAIARELKMHRHTVTKYIYEMRGAGRIFIREMGNLKLCYPVEKVSKRTLILMLISIAFFVYIFFRPAELILAATPTPSPPTVSDSPDPQTGGSSITFSFTCGNSGYNVKGYVCKESNCTGSAYRRPVTLSYTGSELINYQVPVTVDTASLISAGKMRSDCGDVRFTDSDGKTMLSYWTEPGEYGCNSAYTKIWIRIPSIPNGGKTIYMHYGNPSATSESNGAATFLVFDDFDTADASKFTYGSAYGGYNPVFYAIENSALKVWSDSTYRILRMNKTNFLPAQGAAIKIRFQVAGASSSYTHFLVQLDAVNQNRLGIQDNAALGYRIQKCTGAGCSNPLTFGTITANTWYKAELLKRNVTDIRAKMYYNNDTQFGSTYETNEPNWNYGGIGTTWTWVAWQYNAVNVSYDFFFVRNYSDPEPSTSLGSEESIGGGFWCVSDEAASNPSCSYTLPSCCSGINAGANTYYGRCQSMETPYKPYTDVISAQTFTCSKENGCSCTANSECNSTCCQGNGLCGNDCILPTITIESPLNQTYSTSTIWANVTLNEAGSWCGRSLDEGSNITMSSDSSTHFYNQMTGLSSGSHYVKFYCNDTAGNMNISDTRYFTYTPDTALPQYSLNSTNSTIAGAAVEHRLKWTDNVGLSGYIFSFINGTNGTTVYNFSDTSNNKAYNNSVTSEPPTSLSPAGEQEFSSYTGIQASDDVYYESNSTDHPYHKFNITINESVNSIEQINISWEGHTTASGTVNLYVYNFTANSWGSSLTSNSGANDFWLNYSFTSGFSDLIQNGKMSILVQDPSVQSVNTDKKIRSDNTASQKEISYQIEKNVSRVKTNTGKIYDDIFLRFLKSFHKIPSLALISPKSTNMPAVSKVSSVTSAGERIIPTNLRKSMNRAVAINPQPIISTILSSLSFIYSPWSLSAIIPANMPEISPTNTLNVKSNLNNRLSNEVTNTTMITPLKTVLSPFDNIKNNYFDGFINISDFWLNVSLTSGLSDLIQNSILVQDQSIQHVNTNKKIPSEGNLISSEDKVYGRIDVKPRIISASVEPSKVKPGDIMIVTAEVEDGFGIKSVKADMGGIETIDLKLKEGTVYQGIWNKDWLVHGTEVKEYTTTITATNVLGYSSSKEVKWSDPWYYSGWNYRRNITINNSANSNTLTNYQVFVNVTYDSDMNSTFKDLRFTYYNATSQTETEIPYWIQYNVSSSYAEVWINVTQIAANSYQTIYMYYGNPAVETTSNATNTFMFFAEGTSTTGWTVGSGSGVTTSAPSGSPSGSTNAFYSYSGGAGYYLYRNAGIPNPAYVVIQYYTRTTGLGNLYFTASSTGAGTMSRIETRAGNWAGFAQTVSWTSWYCPSTSTTSSANTWYTWTIVINGGQIGDYYKTGTRADNNFGTAINSLSSTYTQGCGGSSPYTYSNSGGYIGLIGDGLGASYITYWQYILIRKYTSPVPTYSIGAEEQADTTPPIVTIQSPLNQTYATTSVWANVTLNEAGSWCGRSLDGTANVSLTNSTGNWNNLMTGLSQGSHNVRFYCNDTAGNMNGSTANIVYFTVDTTPPIVTIQSPSNTTYATTSVWANVTLNEAGSWCGRSLDGGSNVTMTNSTGNWNNLMTSLSQGAHNVRFYCNDTAGNMNGSASNIVYFTVTLESKVSTDFIEVRVKSGWVNDTWVQFPGVPTTESWSNVTKTITNVVGRTIYWKVYANDTSNNWNTSLEYSYTTTSAVDTAFSVAMPSSYTFTSITGTTEAAATSTPSSISFNFTSIPQTDREPYAGPPFDGSNKQSGITQPIFWIRSDSVGTAINISLRYTGTIPSGITLYTNCSCTGCTSCQTTKIALSNSYQQLITGLSSGSYGNVTMYADVASGTAAGESSVTLYTNSSV